MRFALKVAYDGTRFVGNQIQPNGPTVHGELLAAFQGLGTADPALSWAGRTDAGVSAHGNVVCATTEHDAASLLRALSFRMEGVWVWALAQVSDEFMPRHASRRRYRYHVDEFAQGEIGAKALHEAMQVFVGEHDFSVFARVAPGKLERRTVYDIAVSRVAGGAVVDVVGRNFLHNQVRRMVQAGLSVAQGQVAPEVIVDALATGDGPDLGMVPARGLVLHDVEYDHLPFTHSDERVWKRFDEHLANERTRLRVLDGVRNRPL